MSLNLEPSLKTERARNETKMACTDDQFVPNHTHTPATRSEEEGRHTAPLPPSGVPDSCEAAQLPEAGAAAYTAATADGTQLTAALRVLLEPLGFECHPLLVGWYNVQVSARFWLPQPPDTLAVVVMSAPAMFERCFVPHLRRAGRRPGARRDPLDSCMRAVLPAAARRVHAAARVLHDFDMAPGRRPRVLVQTAGHVSGAVHLYRRAELADDPWPAETSVCGCCLHPRYGGWFALRALVVMEGVEAPALPRKTPPEILTTDAQKRELLELFNWHWRDWRYRDVGGTARERYSPLQREYFGTPPGQRDALVERLLTDPRPPADDGGGDAALLDLLDA
ncbi:cyanocobalamin reductase / alkylcobalamin dealkylase-like [Pollicipes pollicipes]|uniref:cyanocobalamin reductase / alkylcobalamin dealkylase-like n=1 Tax=Pollicipes pollicipes TaxID=41117 RepID=UPI0018850B63|nr:cyanocobalamin reductase / alkylcobalamin dealkylase-like [Pollicipes pollicipes]